MGFVLLKGHAAPALLKLISCKKEDTSDKAILEPHITPTNTHRNNLRKVYIAEISTGSLGQDYFSRNGMALNCQTFWENHIEHILFYRDGETRRTIWEVITLLLNNHVY